MKGNHMNDSLFNTIFVLLSPFFPKKRGKVVFFAEFYENSYCMKFYIKGKNGDYICCYDLPSTNRTDIFKVFEKIYALLEPARKELEEKKQWTVMTIIIPNNGVMTVEYDYSDHKNQIVTWEKAWREKYLT